MTVWCTFTLMASLSVIDDFICLCLHVYFGANISSGAGANANYLYICELLSHRFILSTDSDAIRSIFGTSSPGIYKKH